MPLTRFCIATGLILASLLSLAQHTEFLIEDINPGADGSYPSLFLELGNHIYFVAYNGADGQIWRTENGRAADTELVVGGFDYIDNIERVGGQLLFSGQETASGDDELWKHTGTPGDPLVKIDVNPSSSSSPYSIVKAGSRVYFVAITANNGYQVCSIAPNSTVVTEHIAPAPYNTGIFTFSPRSLLNTGVDALVASSSHLFYTSTGPMPAALLALDLANPLAVPTFVTSLVGNNGDGMAPLGSRVCYNRNSDLICADATTVTTVSSGINPTYATAFNGKLYFAGIPSVGPLLSVMYSLDNALTLTEHATIPVPGAVGSTSATLWSLQPNVVPGQLVAWLNDFPVGAMFALYTIDVSGPPVATLASTPQPTRYYDIAYIDNHYYYQHVPWQSNDLQFLKSNATSSSVIASNQNDAAYGEIMAFPGKQMILYAGSDRSESFDCTSGGTQQLGAELYKLNHYQTDCQQVVNVTAADLSLGDVIVADQEVVVSGNNTITSGLCTPIVTPLMTVLGTLNVVPPSQLTTYVGGCP